MIIHGKRGKRMAYIECKVKSKLLQKQVGVHMYFPNDQPADEESRPRAVITLLHGYGGGGQGWV